MSRRSFTCGFTYIELLIVVALLGIVLSVSIPFSMSSLSQTTIIEERDVLVSLVLISARSHALANINQTSHGVHIDTAQHEYTLFQGNVFNPSDIANKKIPFGNENITVSSSGADIIFEALSGNVIRGVGVVTLTHEDTSLEVTLNEVGQINW